MNDIEEICEKFKDNGIAVVPNFATSEECDKMIEKMKDITNKINVEEHIQNVFETESGLITNFDYSDCKPIYHNVFIYQKEFMSFIVKIDVSTD